MAQYGHNWYGTSYYGSTNAFSGWYQTREISTEEPLKSTVSVSIKAILPSAHYAPNSPEVTQVAGTWTWDAAQGKISSSNTNAELLMVATSDQIIIAYEQRTIGAKVKIEVTTTEVGKAPVLTTHTLDTQAGTVNAGATYVISGLPFAEQKVRITMDATSPAGAAFNFKGFTARTSNLTIESRARVQASNTPMPDADYVKLTPTISSISGNEYMITATTPSYAGKKNIQFRIFLASSDTTTTPEVNYIEMVAGDTDNRILDGQWSAIFNMAQIATLAGVSFSKVEEVLWTENVPSTTSLTIRTQSTINNTLGEWAIEPITVPYKLGVNRIKLKDGYLNGWIESPVNAPASKKPYVKTMEWVEWKDQSFLPPDSGGVEVVYDFISPQRDNITAPYVRIVNPMKTSQRSLVGNSRLTSKENVVRITLSRTAGKQTPVVDFIHLTSKMSYSQEVGIENKEFSAVDFNNTGKGTVLDMGDGSFASKFIPPSEAGLPITYELIDETRRPNEVMLYLDSEKTEASRTNKTTTLMNKVWAESKVLSTTNKTGLVKHYQYGGGQVRFPLKDEVTMVNVFTPTTNERLRYRYYLDIGWPTQQHKVVVGENLEAIAMKHGNTPAEFNAINPSIKYNNDGTLVAEQALDIPNNSVNDSVDIFWKSTNNQTTQKSSTNAVLEGNENVESDSIVAEVAEASIYGWVDWVSEEKIYDGVLNLNDTRKDYLRTHITPSSGDSAQIEYVAVINDTYKKIADTFGVYEEDVRKANSVMAADTQPTIGQRVVVPSRITLPAIHPRAAVTDTPYEVQVIYNSVKKKNSKTLPESNVVVHEFNVTHEKVRRTRVEVIRGEIANGKDFLPESRIVNVLKVESGITIYNKDIDFVQEGNAISWEPAGANLATGAVYYVDYEVEVPKTVTIHVKTSYMEEGGVDRIWRSPEVKEFKGMCYPGKDHVALLPNFAEWLGLPNATIEDLDYIVEDSDIWVKTWVEKRGENWYLIGSLQDRVPKDNWFPTIKTGYYYLGQDEYYLFNEPIVIEPTDRDIPIAKNVEFVEGKFQNAAQIQEGSANLVLNSGFEVATSKKTVFKLTF